MSEAQARLIVEQGPQVGQVYTLSDLPIVIGRSQSLSDIVIGDKGVSREHLRISQEGAGIVVEDLGSSNGTYLNGQRIQTPRQAQDGDRLRLGPHITLRLALPAREEATAIYSLGDVAPEEATAIFRAGEEDDSAARVVQRPPTPPQLLVTEPDGATTKYQLTAAEIRLGRHADNDIVIAVPIVSRQHLRLVREGDAYILQILASATNPVYFDGEPVRGARRLEHGDEWIIGSREQTGVQFRYESAPSAQKVPPVESVESDKGTVGGGHTTRIVERPGLETASAGVTPGMETVIGESPLPESSIPPQLVVTVAGEAPEVFTLTGRRLTIGRQSDNDIVVDSRIVSRHHATLEQRPQGYQLIPSPDASNPLLLDGEPVLVPALLSHGAKIRIGGFAPGEMVTLVYLSPADEREGEAQQIIRFAENKQVTIGRDSSNDIVLDAPTISRYHAQVEQIGQRYRVRDLRSSNGTFVNGNIVEGEAWVQPGDAVYIGPYRFVVGEHEFAQYDESEGGMRVEAVGLNKWVRKDLNILQDISLVFQPREFIVVVGQSGGGKSTLVDAIAGYRPATHGRVIVNDSIDVYKEFDAIRNTIGYVPQKDIIHMQLTVFQGLDYAAQLRMPPDTTVEERHQRVQEVMEELDLAHRADTQISELSGGQQKRVSIGVELLTKPGLFFLDEPTSGLDPGMETDLMQLMRRLADQGRTIVLITHATKNVMLADKVVFLARGGYLTWFGPPEEALDYFNQFRGEREQRSRPMEFDDIYNLLDSNELGAGPEWAERYRNHPAYRRYITDPLEHVAPATGEAAEAVSTAPAQRRHVSALRQFLILSARNLKIISRDRASLLLMLLTTPAMASLDFVLAAGMGSSPLGFDSGDFNSVIRTLIVLINNVVLVGGLSQMRELVKEREIYKRERMVNLRLFPYIMSKIWVALILGVYQASVFTLIHYLAFEMGGGAAEVVFFFITMFLLSLAGMMMGLFASAIAPNENAVPLVLVLFIIPQMVLSGALVPLPQPLLAPASSRWAFEAVMAISGAGSDVAGDVCWDLTEEEQELMTAAQKEEECACLGVNALRESSCSFPGLGEYYVAAIDEEDPEEPLEPGDEPPPLDLPPEPQRPDNPNDNAAMQAYLDELAVYNDEVAQLRREYENELSEYRTEQELYGAQLARYQTELAELEVERATAIGAAESNIRIYFDEYGWTFVDTEDRTAYLGTLLTTWAAQLGIILVLFTATVIVQKRRDVT